MKTSNKNIFDTLYLSNEINYSQYYAYFLTESEDKEEVLLIIDKLRSELDNMGLPESHKAISTLMLDPSNYDERMIKNIGSLCKPALNILVSHYNTQNVKDPIKIISSLVYSESS